MTYDEYRALTRTVDTPHGTFAYVDVGDGPATVFVHGLFMSGFMWHQVVDGLRGDRRCILYNLPAHGGSMVAGDQDLGLQSNAEMLEGFCDALGLGEFDMVANDTGGAVAQAYAVRNPDRLRTLALTNCEANDWMPSKADLGQLVKQLAQQGELAPLLKAAYDDRDAARQGVLASTFERPDAVPDEAIRGIMEPHQTTIEGARRLERFAASVGPEELVAIEPELRKLEVPAIAVWGTGDEIFPLSLAHWLRETIPGMTDVVEVDGGKLFWPFERGDELVPHLRRHWSATAASAVS